jgi:histidinol phosphatase-like enzyme
MIIDLLNKFKVRANKSVLVGDSTSDLVAAERCGVRWIHLHSNGVEYDCANTGLRNGICLNPWETPFTEEGWDL